MVCRSLGGRLNTRPGSGDRLDGLVVKTYSSRAADPGFHSHLHWYFSKSSHTSDLKIGTPVATLPGAGAGWPGVSMP